MPIVVGIASPKDAEALAELHGQVFKPGWPAGDFAASCHDPHRIVFNAKYLEGLAGILMLQHAAGEAEILSIAVAERARRRGVASALMHAAIAACRDRLTGSLFLEVAQDNLPAINLYGKAGFEVVAHRRNYYRDASSAAVTALIMKLDTKPALTHIGTQQGRA